MPRILPYVARQLHKKGFAVVPCDGKKPVIAGWNTKRLTQDELDALLNGTILNIGIALNLSDVIDIECDTPEAEAKLQAMFGGRFHRPRRGGANGVCIGCSAARLVYLRRPW